MARLNRILLIAFLLNGALIAADPFDELIKTLRQGEFRLDDGTRFVFPPDDEWPTVLSSTRWILRDETIDRIRSLIPACVSIKDSRSAARRIVLQSELWAAYDCLIQDATSLAPRNGATRDRVFDLARDIAGAIRDVSLDEHTLASIKPVVGPFVNELYQGVRFPEDFIEYVSLEHYTVHEAAHCHRRISRIFFHIPGMDIRDWDSAFLKRITSEVWRLPVGGIAILIDFPIHMTSSGRMLVADLPVALRSYEMRASPAGGARPQFDMALLDDNANLKFAAAEVRAWKGLDLPNIPTNPSLAERVPFRESCADCHGTTVMANNRPGWRMNPNFIRASPGFLVGENDEYADFIKQRCANAKELQVESYQMRSLTRSDSPDPPRSEHPAGKQRIVFWFGAIAALLAVASFVLRKTMTRGASAQAKQR